MSRKWTGKTLADHQADRATVVREALEAAGIEMHAADRMAADRLDPAGRPRFIWSTVDATQADPAMFRQAITSAIRQRQRWRADYELAKSRADPTRNPFGNSSTSTAA